MLLSLVSCSLTETIDILINNHAVINTHPVFGPQKWKSFNCLQKKVAPQQMTMRKLEKILEKLDPSLFETVANKCPCPSPEKVMILINAWVFIRISVVHTSLDNQCEIPKTCFWVHAFYSDQTDVGDDETFERLMMRRCAVNKVFKSETVENFKGLAKDSI